MIEEIRTCKICGKSFESNLKAIMHIKMKHNLSMFDYIKQYFKIPKCKYCEKPVVLYSRPIGAYHRHNRFWHLTCLSKECQTKYNKEVQNKFWSTHQDAVDAARQRRVEYLKERTGKSAWERRSNGEMSYLEEWFFDECIQKYNLSEKYDIINEYCEFPYFIDFAFLNIKVAIELDGKQHFIHGETRKEHDNKKDEFLNEKGWIIFRIGYSENNQETINEFLNFISKIKHDKKELKNRVFKYKEIKSNKQKRSWEQYINEYKTKLFEMNKPLIDLVKNSKIDFTKTGWVTQISVLIDKPPQKVRPWMKKYMPEFLKNCKTRKSISK